MLVHIPLTCIISDTKSTVILKFVPVYVLNNFTLSAFKFLFIPGSEQFDYIFSHVIFIIFLVSGVC